MDSHCHFSPYLWYCPFQFSTRLTRFFDWSAIGLALFKNGEYSARLRISLGEQYGGLSNVQPHATDERWKTHRLLPWQRPHDVRRSVLLTLYLCSFIAAVNRKDAKGEEISSFPIKTFNSINA